MKKYLVLIIRKISYKNKKYILFSFDDMKVKTPYFSIILFTGVF